MNRENGQKICIFIPPTASLQSNSKISLKIEQGFKVTMHEDVAIRTNQEYQNSAREIEHSNYNLTTDRNLSKQLDRVNTVNSANKDLSKRFKSQEMCTASDSKGFQKVNRISTVENINNTEPKVNPNMQHNITEESEMIEEAPIEQKNPNRRSFQMLIQDGHENIFRTTDKTCEFGKAGYDSGKKNDDHTFGSIVKTDAKFGSIVKTDAKAPSKTDTNIFGSKFSVENCHTSVDFTRSVNRHQRQQTHAQESININVPVVGNQEPNRVEKSRSNQNQHEIIVERKVSIPKEIPGEHQTSVNINAPLSTQPAIHQVNPNFRHVENSHPHQINQKVITPLQRSRRVSEKAHSNLSSNHIVTEQTRVVPRASHGNKRYIEVDQNHLRMSPTVNKSVLPHQMPVIQSNTPVAYQFSMLMDQALHNNMSHGTSHAQLPPQPPKPNQTLSHNNSMKNINPAYETMQNPLIATKA